LLARVRPGHRKGARGGREEAPEVAGPKQEDAEQSQATEENVARQIVDSSIGWLERTIESDAYFKGVRRNSLERESPARAPSPTLKQEAAYRVLVEAPTETNPNSAAAAWGVCLIKSLKRVFHNEHRPAFRTESQPYAELALRRRAGPSELDSRLRSVRWKY
jgi:hypothetical protein